MTQGIDPIKLKAAAEHLEWVLRQYPDDPHVQGLLDSLLPLIEDAKRGRITRPISRDEVPCRHNFTTGLYVPYQTPSVENAYVDFAVQLRGGHTEQELRILESIRALSSGTQP